MDYYRIMEPTDLHSVLRPHLPSNTQIWSGKEPIFLPGSVQGRGREEIFLPFYESRVMLISSEIKSIWQSYQKGGRYRPCAFGSIGEGRIKPYSFMLPRVMEEVHPSTEYFPNGEIKKLVLDKERIGSQRVFGVCSLRHLRLIVAEDVLEEMLRKSITGFCWKRIEVQ